MNNLLTQCNADVFKAILEVKEQSPEIGEKLIALLQDRQYWWQMTAGDVMWFSAHLPRELWNGKINTFHYLFQSELTTPNL